ncbi:MAG: GNAT family N-acetyltransferase [Oscillospiraceae bacterium]|nr:GNAT family N-acetyltransferase [Oscillospiraceae bacterium]
MEQIRKAGKDDVSRIAEILIFTKRTAYRPIFQNDRVSFGEMQVLPLAQALLEDEAALGCYWVYDDGIVKGLVRISGDQVEELYVDPFFQGEGVGSRLLCFAVGQKGCRFLWVLEKNKKAVAFYQSHGFAGTGERKPQEGTEEEIIRMKWSGDRPGNSLSPHEAGPQNSRRLFFRPCGPSSGHGHRDQPFFIAQQ